MKVWYGQKSILNIIFVHGLAVTSIANENSATIVILDSFFMCHLLSISETFRFLNPLIAEIYNYLLWVGSGFIYCSGCSKALSNGN